MADLTFKGTTQQVLFEIGKGASSKIDANTKVTINDNNYTLANLIDVIDAGGGLNYKVVLEKTSAAFELSGDETDILKMLAGVNNYTGPLTVTDGTAGYAISSADLNKIAAGTTGKVTATIDNSEDIDQTLVSALQDVKTSDNITFKPADDTLTNNAEISALISLSKILPKADFSAIDTIEGSANDVAVIKQALAILKNNTAVAVEITGSINAADINAISKATKGVLTADIRDGSIKATLSALKDIDQNVKADKLTFKSTDTTASAKDMVALAAKTDDEANFDFTSVKTITADAKDADSVVDALGLTTINSAPEIKISGNVELADITSIITASNSAGGKVIANVKAGTDADLLAAITTAAGTDVLNLTVTGATATATTLLTLDGKTAGTIAVEATTISGNTADLVTLYTNAANTFTKLGNESVIFTNSPSLTQLNTVAAATSGKVTATLAATTPIDSDTVTALSAVKSSDNISLTSSIATIAGDDLSALLAIKKIIPNANFASIASITAVNASDVALVKNAIKLVAPTATVTFTVGEISAADANTISNATSGAVTATIKDGSVAATLKALKDVDVIAKADVFTFASTDKTAKASDLVALSDKIGAANFTAAKIETVTGTAADAASGDIAAALGGLTTNPEVKISGTVDSAYIKAIIDATNGKVTATLAADTAVKLKTALTDSSATDENAINVTVTDGATATAADILNDVAKATTGKVKVDAKDLTGNLADVGEVYFINKSKFTALGNENVTVTGGPSSALDVDAIAKATSGVLTAAVSNATANVLVSQLKSANAKDALKITVIDPLAGTTSAKDLIALTKKTSEVITANALTNGVSGSASEINSLLRAEKSTGVKYVTLAANVPFTITGTAKAADVNDIALKTTGAVTATVAADTAAKLLSSLNNTDNLDMLTLTVNGATASVAELTALYLETCVDIKVDAKEITGTGAELSTLYSTLPGTQPVGFANIGNENVKATDVVAVANIANILKTSGIVTAAVAADAAAALKSAVATATANDKLTLTVTNVATTAADLLALDNATSVKVNATAIVANGISGTAADLKQLVASKGVELAKNVAITVDVATATNAADLATILKATTGVVTAANVKPDTAAALNKALKDASGTDALTLVVNGAAATAKDLIELSGKTSVTGGVTVTAVTSITGNIDEVTKLFVTNKADFTGLAAQNVTISGTVTAAEADAIATATTGTVTATIAADTVSKLDDALTETGANAHALKLTTKGDDTTAADLNRLDTKTTVAINANSIKNIDGTTATGAADVNTVYLSAKAGQISGLGNETVDLTGATDANVALVNAINGFTTGVITLPELTFGATATTFALKNLGDLKGITGLVEINAKNGGTDVKDIINISLKDLLEANDSKTDFTLNITTATGATLDVVNLTNDVSGWTGVAGTGADANKLYTYTNDKTHQVVTITANEAIIA